MAIAFVKNGGANSAKASASTLAATVPAGGHAAGSLLVVHCSTANQSTPPAVSSITDSRGNTYVSKHAENSQGFRGEETFVSVLGTALQAGDTITVTWATAANCRAIVTAEFSGVGATEDVASVSATGNSGAPSSGAMTPASAAVLLIGGWVYNRPSGDTFTEDTDNAGGDTWHTVPKVGTTGGSAASNITSGFAYKITTSAVSQSYDPTNNNSGTWAADLLAFQATGGGAALDPGTIADALAITDAVALSRGLTVADPVAITDAQAFGRELAQADALGITDSLSSAGAFVRSVDDALAITDAAVAGLAFAVPVNDALAVTDAVRMDVALAQADALGITDAAALAQNKAFADALGLVDSAAPIILKAVTIDDALAITDNVTSVAALARSVADALAITDSLSSSSALARAVADNIAITDAVAFVRELALADALGLTDSQAFAVALSLADALGLVDAATPAGGYLRSVADAVGITDAITPLWTPGGAPTYIDLGAVLTLELDSITRTLELAERTATLDLDATERGVELDDTTRGFDLDG